MAQVDYDALAAQARQQPAVDYDALAAQARGERKPDFTTTVKASDGVLPDFVTGADNKPSMAGFAKNVLTSGANFVKDIATPLVHPKQTAEGLLAAISQPTLTGKLIKEAVIKRYGSVDALLATLYNDPVGAASDASMVLGPVAGAAKAAGMGKAARYVGAASEALNPLAIPSKLAETGGRAAYGAAINPSRRIRRGFPGAVDKGYEMNVLPTEGGLRRTERALEQSAGKTDALLAKADAAGAPKVTSPQITPALQEPMLKAWERTKTGAPDERPALAARGQAIQKEMGAGVKLVPGNRVKRQAQTLADSAFRAQERGAIIKDLDALADKNVAAAYQKAIEANAASVGVDGIKESNKQTQSLIGLAQALEDATQQPSRLTHLMATLGGVGGALTGGTGAGAGAYVAGRIATAKPVMAGAGLLVGKGSKVVRNAQILRALALLKASEQQPQQ